MIRHVQIGNLDGVTQIQQSVDFEEARRAVRVCALPTDQSQLSLEQSAQLGRHRAIDLEPHDFGKGAAFDFVRDQIQ